jgi:glycosyltransferase involved in cell wall biosynthesis
VLFFGRLVLEKGVKEYVSTVLRLREHGLKVRPLVVGAGPARDAFEALEDAVFTGHLDGAELGRAIASADVLLHPSRTEAFGNVVLEAMASGLAVVCARAESSEALVDDGRNGLLCDDWDASVRAVADLSNDAPRRKRMGAAARGAAQRFSWDEASASVHSVYRSLIAEPAQVLVTRP